MPHTHPSIYEISTLIFSKFKHVKFFHDIYTVIFVSLLALSEILNEVFLGKEQASKSRQPKIISFSYRFNAINFSDGFIAPDTTSRFRVAGTSQTTQLSWLFLCYSHASCIASHASFHASFISFPKAFFCVSSCMKTISNLFAFNMCKLFLEKLTPSTLSVKFYDAVLKYF